jgi:hypothetical protein
MAAVSTPEPGAAGPWANAPAHSKKIAGATIERIVLIRDPNFSNRALGFAGGAGKTLPS